jgi:hypothetical protein
MDYGVRKSRCRELGGGPDQKCDGNAGAEKHAQVYRASNPLAPNMMQAVGSSGTLALDLAQADC